MKQVTKTIDKANPASRLPIPGPGRPKGVPNKFKRTAKENIEKVFEALGGWKGMETWARKSEKNKTIFYSDIFPKLISLDVSHSGEISHLLSFDFGNENGMNGKE
jgi:hypothetical protein